MSPKNPMIRGIDVSHYQLVTDWGKVKQGGYSFVYAKATQGTNYKSPVFLTQVKGAQDEGLLVGAYHFFDPDVSPTEQAKFFCAAIEMANAFGLPPAVDLEYAKAGPDKVPAILTFLKIVAEQVQKVPMIYASPSFLESLGLGPLFAHYPLWIAHYGVDAPKIPLPWSSFSFWQIGQVDLDGIVGPVDVDVYQGSAFDLHQLCQFRSA